MILSHTLIVPMSQVQTQQLMMSQIRSHIEYVIQAYNILFILKIDENVVALAHWRFLIRFNNDS